MSGDGKYQDHGHPGLAAIARVISKADRRSLSTLARMMTMSVAVGNLDMHAKNISLLHLPDGSARLAPAYDVVPQLHFDFDPDVALHVNGKRDHASITIEDLVLEARSWGLRSPEASIRETIERIDAFVTSQRPHAGAHFSLAGDIHRVCERLLDGRAPASAPLRPTSAAERGQEGGVRPYPQSPGGWGGPVSR